MTATIEESIEAALFAKVLELTDLDGDPTFAWPNMPFDPPTGAPWIRVDHFPNKVTRLFSKGSNPHLRQGILQLTVHAPLNGGAPTALAGSIAAQFPADLEMFEDGIKLRIQAAPDVFPPDKTDTSWDVPVSISYEVFA